MHNTAVKKVIATHVFFSSHFFNPLYSMQVLIFCARVCVPIAVCRQLEGQQRFQGCTQCSKLLTEIYRRWGFSRWTVQHHMQTHQARRGVWQYTLILSPPSFFFTHQSWRKPFLVWQHNILWIQRDNTYSTWGSSGHGYGEIARHQRLASRDLLVVTGP